MIQQCSVTFPPWRLTPLATLLLWSPLRVGISVGVASRREAVASYRASASRKEGKRPQWLPLEEVQFDGTPSLRDAPRT
ncbi:hypothetical protein FNW02_26945 [Komarekiella sp. 'clone 1']|uniref:Uncharacterized protein n=1 Tax=Komarekiella delphini-convector SJRDD-AB1 TaxID=2593771 RepID=A0AA40VTQ9_9NOST|nr:hypothetical protein [Komarekiella delphini-convector]MBD6619367.1 hypothetical protein [Komarekiella delphini-convector SJRDD-AB1]